MSHPTPAPSLMPWLAGFARCFTAPRFQSFLYLMTGWLVCLNKHLVTRVVRAAGAVGAKHITSFHRFFRAATWRPDTIGLCLLRLVLAALPGSEPIVLVIDDSLCRHTGKKISGAAMHHDPLLSTRAKVVHHWGHVWVVLAVVVPVPGWNQRFALPVLCRLYRPQKLCQAQGRPFVKKTEMACELIGLMAKEIPGRRILVVADTTCSNQVLCKHLPPGVEFIGRAHPKAALYALPGPRQRLGRPRVKGDRLPSPAQRAGDPTGWRPVVVSVYGRSITLLVKSFDALWYRVAGGRLMRFVLVRGWPGHDEDDVLCTTALGLDARAIIEYYCWRWSIEVAFQEVKGKLGMEEPQNRTARAVERTAPMALWAYTFTVLWYLEQHARRQVPALLDVPWYSKRIPAFSDMLAALRFETWQHWFLDTVPNRRDDQNSLDQLLREFAYAT